MAIAVVTGATGFIGTHLVAYLRSLNWRVIALVRRASNAATLEALGAQVVRLDMADRTAVLAAVPQRADVLFHLSCAPFDTGLAADNIARVNEDGLRNALFAATDKKVACTVYVSDAICYGNQSIVIDEKTELAPPNILQGAYARSRRECEAIFGRAIARGLDAVSIMPGAVIGHGLRPYRAKLFQAALQSDKVTAPDGGRSFVDVASLVPMIVRAAERGMTGQRYLVGGPYQSWAEILQRFVDVNGLSTNITEQTRLGQVMQLGTQIIRKLAPAARRQAQTNDWMWACDQQISAHISALDLDFQSGDIDTALKALYACLSAY
jgi:dihydroflavonol-4-reductase